VLHGPLSGIKDLHEQISQTFSTSAQLKRRSSLQYHRNSFIHVQPNVNMTESCKGLNERNIPSLSLAQIGSS
jgi:hypothetical protein